MHGVDMKKPFMKIKVDRIKLIAELRDRERPIPRASPTNRRSAPSVLQRLSAASPREHDVD